MSYHVSMILCEAANTNDIISSKITCFNVIAVINTIADRQSLKCDLILHNRFLSSAHVSMILCEAANTNDIISSKITCFNVIAVINTIADRQSLKCDLILHNRFLSSAHVMYNNTICYSTFENLVVTCQIR